MKRILSLAILSVLVAVPSLLMAQENGTYDHASVGIFADYFRFDPNSDARVTNFIGFGARAGFNVSHHTSLEGEMNYDFERNFTKGMLDSRPLVLYVSATLFCLFLTVRSVESRRWRA